MVDLISLNPSDLTMKVGAQESGEVLATFTCNSLASCCCYSQALKLFVARDASGQVHFFASKNESHDRQSLNADPKLLGNK